MCNPLNHWGLKRWWLVSSRNLTRIQTKTLRKTETYFCRHLEQENLQKMNMLVKIFVIQNSISEYSLRLSIQAHLELPDIKLRMPLSEKLIVLWGWQIGLRVCVEEKFWGATSGWHDKKNVLNGWINLYSCNTNLRELNNVLIYYIDCVQN